MKKPEDNEKKSEFKYIVRLAGVELDGHRTTELALTKIRGIGIRTSDAVLDALNLSRNIRIGELSDETIELLNEKLENINKLIPHWMTNRQRDFYTNENKHLICADLDMSIKDDINLLKKIKCYRGIRHEKGLRVRGQRTKSHPRKGLIIGVSRKGIKKAQESEKKEKKK